MSLEPPISDTTIVDTPLDVNVCDSTNSNFETTISDKQPSELPTNPQSYSSMLSSPNYSQIQQRKPIPGQMYQYPQSGSYHLPQNYPQTNYLSAGQQPYSQSANGYPYSQYGNSQYNQQMNSQYAAYFAQMQQQQLQQQQQQQQQQHPHQTNYSMPVSNYSSMSNFTPSQSSIFPEVSQTSSDVIKTNESDNLRDDNEDSNDEHHLGQKRRKPRKEAPSKKSKRQRQEEKSVEQEDQPQPEESSADPEPDDNLEIEVTWPEDALIKKEEGDDSKEQQYQKVVANGVTYSIGDTVALWPEPGSKIPAPMGTIRALYSDGENNFAEICWFYTVGETILKGSRRNKVPKREVFLSTHTDENAVESISKKVSVKPFWEIADPDSYVLEKDSYYYRKKYNHLEKCFEDL
jgi:hypothetical protein